MGKRERASFSFDGKSNSGLSTKKKSAADASGGKNEEDERKKHKKRFWWKWVSFLRRRWSSHGALQDHGDKREGQVTQEIFGKWNAAVGDGETGVIEIPIEPGRKISKILIKPTKSEIKAMLAQYAAPPPPPHLESSGDGSAEPVAPGNPRRAAEPDGNRPKLVDGCARPAGTRPNWSAEIFGGDLEVARNSESPLKPSLFIRQEMDALLFEPKGSVQSEGTEEIIQRCRKSTERHVDVELPNEKGDQMGKTASEPTWNERRRLFRQQQLKDNINNLLEQFLWCLEAEDVLDLTLSRSGVAKCKRRLEFDQDQALGLKGLSREVSPEILVNIKPFKEHVSDKFLTSATSFIQSKFKSKCIPLEPAGRTRERAPKFGGRQWESRGSEQWRKEDECVAARTSAGGNPDDSPRAISIMEKDGPGYQGEVSLRFVYDAVPATPTCTVWGVYRTYSRFDAAPRRASSCPRERGSDADAVDADAEDADSEDADADAVDADAEDADAVNLVLDDVDDADHDKVFQRNIAQFRKKINLVPRLESSSCIVRMTKSQQKRFLRADSAKRKMETFRFEQAMSWLREGKRGETLETACLLLGETELFCQILSTRIEAGAIERPQEAREVHPKQESINSATVERKVPAKFEEDLKLLPLSVERRSTGTLLGVCGGGGGHFSRSAENGLAESFKIISDVAAINCYCVFPESVRFGTRATIRTSGRDVETPTASAPPRRRVAEEEKEEKGEGKGVEVEGRTGKKIESLELMYEPARSVVRVVCGESCHAVIVCDGDPAAVPPKAFPRCPSEGKVKARPSKSRFWAIEEEAPAAANGGRDEKRSKIDTFFDGFQIIYNNSNGSLEDEEDATKPSYSCSLTKKPSFLFVVDDSGTKFSEKRTNAVRCSYQKPGLRENAGSRTLTFRSNSSPKALAEFGDGENCGRRFFSREAENEFPNWKKRRLSLDKCVEIRRMESVLGECVGCAPGRDGATFVEEEEFRRPTFPEDAEQRSGEGKKVIVVDSGGGRTRKDVVAALNSIREMSAAMEEDKGGKRRMSLVILLSKK